MAIAHMREKLGHSDDTLRNARDRLLQAYESVVKIQSRLEWGSPAEVAVDVVRLAIHDALLRVDWAKQWTETQKESEESDGH